MVRSLPVDDGQPEAAPTDDLLNRFFALARPIANAFHEPGLHMKLGDIQAFLDLIDALQGADYPRIDETLLVFLDEFGQLEQRSYDELYLWCIVYLSRANPEHVETFWPLVLTLDRRFRAEPWSRPNHGALTELPYRMIELVMFYYVEITLQPEPRTEEEAAQRLEDGVTASWPRYPSLATCLRRIFRQLDEERVELLLDTLRELARQERRPAFGDAHGLLQKVR
jgi:hypothetical protein